MGKSVRKSTESGKKWKVNLKKFCVLFFFFFIFFGSLSLSIRLHYSFRRDNIFGCGWI